LVAIAIPVGLLAGGVALDQWIKAAAPRRWNEMRMTCEAMAREASSYDPKRPVLRGIPHPGNGWEDYEAALAPLKSGWKGAFATEFLEGSPKADPSQVRQWVGTLAPALDRLRAGASKELVQRHVDWESQQSPYFEAQRLASLSFCQARFLGEAGRATDAAELLLDTALFGEDFGRTGFEIDALNGVFIVGRVLDELRRLILSGDLGSDALERIDRELEALDRGISSSGETWFRRTVELGYCFLGTGSVQAFMTKYEYMTRKPSAWRFGFSEQIMMVDAFQTSLSAMRLCRQAADRPWREARRLQAEADAVWARCSNPLLRMMTERFDSFSPNDPFRELRAQLRLLRTAAHYKATGEILDLEDPFGEKLLHSSKSKSLRMWSVGPDGVDDGGSGEWHSAKGKDIVLEVGR
jgi:hypothetical protein